MRWLLVVVVLLVPALVPVKGTDARSEIVTVGLDMEVSGNSPRSAEDIDQCSSVEVGVAALVDVALPEPGVPADRGVSAYQFTLFYDSTVVSLTGDNTDMLLDQAPGSALIPLAEAKPDTDGVYTSAVVDFGPDGIEPAGTSETGPGVLARLTLTPHSAGASGLVIKDVIIKDDAGDDIEIISILSAHLYVGMPCPGQASPAPAAPSTQTPAASPTSPATRSVTTGPVGLGPASSPADLIQTGGNPRKPGGQTAALVVVIGGLSSLAAGLAAMASALSRGRL